MAPIQRNFLYNETIWNYDEKLTNIQIQLDNQLLTIPTSTTTTNNNNKDFILHYHCLFSFEESGREPEVRVGAGEAGKKTKKSFLISW